MNSWYAILAFICGNLIAQLWKLLRGIIHDRKHANVTNFKTAIGYFMRSGGMPSGHSASMTAMTTYLGMMAGFDSGLFALSVAMTLIVIYDAIHVRYAVGEQGKALNNLLKKDHQKPLPLVEGHTMAQAAVGVIIGVSVGVLFGFLTKT